MVNYYSRPIPGIGSSFHNLITDESQFLANKITQTQLQTVIERVADFESRMDSPGFGDFLGTLIYTAVTIFLPQRRPSPSLSSPMGSSPRRSASWSARSSYRSSSFRTRMDLLGLVQGVHPICLLPGHRRSRCVHHCQPHSRDDESPAERNNLTTQLLEFFPVLFITFLGVHLRPPENPGTHEPHLQWQLRRLFRRHIWEHEKP